jgi:hypothetical protein
MTDITKYRNVSLTHETYKTLISVVEGIIARCTHYQLVKPLNQLQMRKRRN